MRHITRMNIMSGIIGFVIAGIMLGFHTALLVYVVQLVSGFVFGGVYSLLYKKEIIAEHMRSILFK